MKNWRLVSIVSALAVTLAVLSGCDKFKGMQLPETKCYYTVSADGDLYFVWLDRLDDRQGTASGHWYACTEGPDAPIHRFSAEFSKKKLVIKEGDKEVKFNTTDVSWDKYVAPDFNPEGTELYRQPFCEVEEEQDVVYGNAVGYWTSLPGVEADVSKLFSEGYIKSFNRRDLDLTMDVYKPVGVEGKRPFILFIHGGAFYVGDKREPAYIDFCQHFASTGYVCASMNYRMGFHMSKGAIERAAYMCVQDAHAAMRYIVTHADEYNIDTNQLYVAGSSAGSITALNLAFMDDESRPDSSHGRNRFIGSRRELGDIEDSGNDLKAQFHIQAVANLWGAVSSLDILKNSKTSIVSFHGDADKVVPYDEGYPFSSAGDAIASTLSDKMYGSVSIFKEASRLGLRTIMYPFPGEGHAFNTTGKDKKPNANHLAIRDAIADFFFHEMVPETAIVVADGDGWYHFEGPNLKDVQWQADGGFIILEGPNKVKVLWRHDKRIHSIKATGMYKNGLGFIAQLNE